MIFKSVDSLCNIERLCFHWIRTKIWATELQRFKFPSESLSQMAIGATYGFTSLILDLCILWDLCILCIVDRVPYGSLWFMVYCILKDCTLFFEVLPLKWNFNLAVLKIIPLATCHEVPTHWKRPWCWKKLRSGEEGGNREWDGWMTSPIQWTWVWTNFGI